MRGVITVDSERPISRGGRWLLPATLAAALAALAPADAEAGPAGTHLLLEMDLGLGIPPVTYLGPNVAGGGLIGIGGKFPNFPLRFYFVVGAEAAEYTGEGTHPQTGLGYDAERLYVDIYGGLRMLLPIYDEIRWYVDILGGASYLDGEVSRDDGPTLTKEEWAGECILATGLQYRWAEYGSTGIRAEVIFGSQDAELLDTYAGEGEGGGVRFGVLVTQTWHI